MSGQGGKPAGKRNAGPPSASPRHIVLGDPKDEDEGPNSLRVVTGSRFKSLNSALIDQAARTLWLGSSPSEERLDALYSAAVSALMEFKPTDGIEGMMAVQAVGLHNASAECLRRAMLPDQPFEASDKLRKQAANLSRAFLDVLAALDRKRGKGGQQVVRVERVMVGPGGQAMVGNVQAGVSGSMGQDGGGVGRGTETEGEPHAPPAQLAHDVTLGPIVSPVQGTNPGRNAVPVTRDDQRTMPDAWRL